MKKIIIGLSVVLFVSISFLMACSSGKNAAELAIKTAEEAVNATKAEAAKILPDEVKSLEDALAAVKEKVIKKEYKEALEEATALAGKAKGSIGRRESQKGRADQKMDGVKPGGSTNGC